MSRMMFIMKMYVKKLAPPPDSEPALDEILFAHSAVGMVYVLGKFKFRLSQSLYTLFIVSPPASLPNPHS